MRLRALVLAAVAIAITGTYATAAQAAPSTSDLTKQINTLSNKLEDVTESYNAMNEQLKKTVAQEKTLAASLPGAKAALQAATVQMGTMASAAYMQGNVGGMNAILGSPGDLLQRMSYLDQLSRDRQRDIASYTATTQDYNGRQAALKTVQDKQAAQVKVLSKTKTDIQSQINVLLAKRKAAYGRSTEPGSSYNGPIPNIAGSAGEAVAFAYKQLGKPYHYASDGPGSYDCSGLTMASWNAAGKSLPHNAREQYYATARVSKSALKPGDLVFYRSLQHVAIYVGSNTVIAAPQTGENVQKQSINIMTPYGYGRVK
jgi:cell wall-associated NlpC family hydrolase